MKTKKARALFLLACILCAAYGLRIYGIQDRGFFNDDFLSYYRESIFLDDFFEWRANTSDLTPASFQKTLDEKIGWSRPSHAKPLHLEFHRLAFRMFGKNRDAVSHLGAILGVLCVGVTWMLGRRLFGENGALLAAFLAAISGYHVMYAGRGYNHVLVTLFSALTALALTEVYSKSKKRSILAAFVTGLLSGLALASHYNVVACLPLLALFVFIGSSGFIKLINPVLFIAGTAIPFAAFERYYDWLQSYYPRMETYLQQMLRQFGTAGGTRMDFQNLPKYFLLNGWLDGWFVSCLFVLGVIIFLATQFRHLLRLRMKETGPLAYIVAITVWSFVLWGSYNYKIPRTQTFAMIGYPLLAAYAAVSLFRYLYRKCGPRASVAVAAICLVALTLEGTYKCSRLFYLGKGHRELRNWVASHNRHAAGNFAMAATTEGYRFPRPLKGRYDLWYLDVPEFAKEKAVDSLAVDYPSLFHNYVFNNATHPGSVQFAQLLFAKLNAEYRPLLEVRYMQPKICQLENGYIWNLKYSAEQPLSHFLRLYDMKDVLQAYAFAAAEFTKRTQP